MKTFTFDVTIELEATHENETKQEAAVFLIKFLTQVTNSCSTRVSMTNTTGSSDEERM